MNSSRLTFSKAFAAQAPLAAPRVLFRIFLGHRGWMALALLMVLPACQRTQVKKEPLQPADMGAAALHAVHSEKLKEIMTELNNLAYRRLPQELEASQRQTELRKVAEVAEQLTRSVDAIPKVAQEFGMSAEDQKVFLVLARQLRTQADKLDGQANRGKLRAVEATMQEISGTCVACHTLFRELSSPTPSSNP